MKKGELKKLVGGSCVIKQYEGNINNYCLRLDK